MSANEMLFFHTITSICKGFRFLSRDDNGTWFPTCYSCG